MASQATGIIPAVSDRINVLPPPRRLPCLKVPTSSIFLLSTDTIGWPLAMSDAVFRLMRSTAHRGSDASRIFANSASDTLKPCADSLRPPY